jgi:hypothetical protein
MNDEPIDGKTAGTLDLGDVVHQLRGLCGLFNLVGEKVSEDSDAVQVFHGAIERMEQLIATIDGARQRM